MKERGERRLTQSDPARKQRRVILAVYGAALLYFILKQIYYIAFTDGFPDYMAHYAYLIEAARQPFRIPDFRAMPLYQIIGESGGMIVFSPTPGTVNYLAHPPLYYWLMSLVSGVQIRADGTAAFSILRVQAANLLLTSGTLAAAYRLGYTRLKGRSPVVHALYAFAVATLPMLAYVGVSLNNDNLAFLAMVVFFTGLLRYEEDRLDMKTYLLLGFGFLLGSFSKLTTALMFLIMLAACLVMDLIRTRSLRLVANRYFAVTLPFYLVFLAYELLIHREYGAWIPSLGVTAPEFFLQSNFYVPEDQRIHLTFIQYFRRFAAGIGHTWSSLYGHNEALQNTMNNGYAGLVFWVTPAAAAAGVILSRIRKAEDRIGLPVLFGFAGTLAYHLFSNWKGYTVSGYLGGAQARYYLAMIVPLAWLMCSRGTGLFRKQRRLGTVLAVLLIAAWIAGDMPRLLLIWGLAPVG